MTESHPEKKIIVIPAKNESPQEQAKKRNLRVAAYCRVSTGDEEQLTSYENQKAFYTEKIMKNPEWTMVDIFADEGITGTSTCRRKDFLRMIRQCRQGKIDMILAKSVSRFARNTLDTISYTRELRSLGIAVIFEEQNINSIYPESEFLIALHAAFAQSESESISANVRWGKRQSIKDGKVTFQYKTLLGYEKGGGGTVRSAEKKRHPSLRRGAAGGYPGRPCGGLQPLRRCHRQRGPGTDGGRVGPLRPDNQNSHERALRIVERGSGSHGPAVGGRPE